jgi:hypothetical protein
MGILKEDRVDEAIRMGRRRSCRFSEASLNSMKPVLSFPLPNHIATAYKGSKRPFSRVLECDLPPPETGAVQMEQKGLRVSHFRAHTDGGFAFLKPFVYVEKSGRLSDNPSRLRHLFAVTAIACLG